SFQIAPYPVTNQFYNRVMGLQEKKAPDPLEPKVNISWYDAIEFCNTLSRQEGLEECYSLDREKGQALRHSKSDGYRLPTEGEWQYACKAGSPSYQYLPIDKIAWHKENSQGHLHRVGEKEPNQWGLYDMLGHVWEWCWDLFNEETYGPYRIFRGGSFAEEKRICGATTRRKSHPEFAIDDLGFRLARSLPRGEESRNQPL
ncbi:MAG: SUMF1/EgtB/PvdO family nonheme iron enzyme, partial [Spirochaetales bacterium]|nr:SUMF1/EgtB/PvdO family nonheme iron enzyme [Spirochaetales bacterium]